MHYRLHSLRHLLLHTATISHVIAIADASTPLAKRTDPSRGADPSDVKYTGGLTGVDQVGNYLFVNIFLGLSLALAGILFFSRIFLRASNSVRHQFAIARDPDQQKIYTHNSTYWWPWLKRNVLYAPLLRARHCRELLPFKILKTHFSFGVLPLRLDAFIILAYLILNIAGCFSINYGQERAAWVAELRGRSGALATYNIPPTVLFALRGNPFIYLAGISFDTFNLYHRWFGRIVVLESLIHTFAFAYNWVDVHGAADLGPGLTGGAFHINGFLALLAMFTMILFAWSPIRHAWYEVFVNSHRLMFWVAIITTYKHLDLGRLPQLPWVQLTMAAYILEWAARAARLLYYNASRKRGWTSVTVTALPGEACKVSFFLARPGNFVPGTFVHMYLPAFTPWVPWTSHPFSVAWTEDMPRNTAAADDVEKGTPFDPDDPDCNRSDHVCTRVELITKVRSGLTARLYAAASAAPSQTLTTWGGIEGPYGARAPLDSYGTVLLFAGGVGITGQLLHVRQLLRGMADGTVATRRIELIWSITSDECMRWVSGPMDEILAMPGRREALKVMVFLTKPKNPAPFHSRSKMVVMNPGRCHPETIIDQAVRSRVGAMAVTCCGPGPFMDAVRAAARRRMQVANLDYVEDAFTY